MTTSSPENACNPPCNTTPAPGAEPIVVMGIGNVLWADEGFGVRCVEALQARWEFADHVQLIDGGTQGLYLIPYVHAARRLLILDAVDYGLEPGTLKLVANDEVPKFLGAKKMSLHQTGFQEVLMLAQLTGAYPDEVLLVGCQPEELEDYGGSLRETVKAALERALPIAVAQIEQWGGAPRLRTAPPTEAEAVTNPMLSLQAYESGRPPPAAACRIGDERFLATGA